MTNFAVTIRRLDARAALSTVLGRPVTNEEQSAFVQQLMNNAANYVETQAYEFKYNLSAPAYCAHNEACKADQSYICPYDLDAGNTLCYRLQEVSGRDVPKDDDDRSMEDMGY